MLVAEVLEGFKMTYEANIDTKVSLVKLSGDIDIASAGTLLRLEKRLAGRENIVFDVADLDFVDATFLGFLMRLKERASKERSTNIELLGAKPNLRRILQVTGLNHVFHLWPKPA